MNRILLINKRSLRIIPVPGEPGVYSFAEFSHLQSAVRQLSPFVGDPYAMAHLRALLGSDAAAMDPFRLTDQQVVQGIAEKVMHGRVGIATPLDHEIPQWELDDRAPDAPPPPAPRQPRKKTWIEFIFTYSDGSPVSGLDYVLEDPDGTQEAGTLPQNGTIRRDGIPEGTYTAILKEIESVNWSPARIRCDETTRVQAKVSGFAYGSRAKVKIYRELRETKDDVLQTLDARVVDDRIDVQWKYDYTSSEERSAETGVARFIAEVEFAGGKPWAKTLVPLEVQLKSIRHIAWSSDRVAPGAGVMLDIETAGYADGTQVKLELWTIDQEGSYRKSVDLKPAKLSGNKASVECRYGKSAPISIPREGEYFVKASIQDKVTRHGQSDLLWCMYGDAASGA